MNSFINELKEVFDERDRAEVELKKRLEEKDQELRDKDQELREAYAKIEALKSKNITTPIAAQHEVELHTINRSFETMSLDVSQEAQATEKKKPQAAKGKIK